VDLGQDKAIAVRPVESQPFLAEAFMSLDPGDAVPGQTLVPVAKGAFRHCKDGL
jgi:hypothetical protein